MKTHSLIRPASGGQPTLHRIGILAMVCFLLPFFGSEVSASDSALLSMNHVKLPPSRLQKAAMKQQFVMEQPASALRGWEHLYRLMVDQGVDPFRLQVALSDPRMPVRKPLYFAVKPKEPRALYRGHNNQRARKNALLFHAKQQDYFSKAEDMFGVPQEVILAIMQIETKCGGYTGRSPVFYRLARLAAAAQPENIDNNFRVRYAGDHSVTREDVAARAKWLEKTFLPHTIAALELSDRLQVHPLDIKGSHAGAIGLPQFLPGNVHLHGWDADHDGEIDLHNPPDAILSVARFLANHGWTEKTLTRAEKSAVVFHYNRSKSYVATVLNMAEQLKPEILKRKQRAKSSPPALAQLPKQ